MDQSTKVTHFNQQIADLMLFTNNRDKAAKAYLDNGEDPALAANTLFFDSLINMHFSDHFRSVMATHKNIAIRIYDTAQLLNVLSDDDDLYQFACLVAEIINKDRASVSSLADVNVSFNEALKEHLKSLLKTPEKERMLDVAQAFH